MERYSDEELEEFRQIIEEKLVIARSDYEMFINELSSANDNEDRLAVYQTLEEGSPMQPKETLIATAARAQKFIQSLEAALLRIQNKTYGICRETGKLIPKERLRLVPHATLSIEAKQMRDKKR